MTYCEHYSNNWCQYIIRRKNLSHSGFEIGLIYAVGCNESDTYHLEYKKLNLYFLVKYYLKYMIIRICYNFLLSIIPNFKL